MSDEVFILHDFRLNIQQLDQSDARKRLSFEAYNLFLRMLTECHRTGELPADPDELAGTLGGKTNVPRLRELLPEVLPWFESKVRTIKGEPYEYLTNTRVDEVRGVAIASIKRSKAHGKLGGRPKNNPSPDGPNGSRTTEPTGLPNGNPPVMQAEPGANLEPNRTEPNRIEHEPNAVPANARVISMPSAVFSAEGWEELCEAAASAGMSFDPDINSLECREYWAHINSMETRLAAIKGIRDRVACGEYNPQNPRFSGKLKNYLADKRWRNSLQPRSEQSAPPARHPATPEPYYPKSRAAEALAKQRQAQREAS